MTALRSIECQVHSYEAFVPMASVRREAQTLHELAQLAATKLVATASFQGHDAVIDKDSHHLLIGTVTGHLLEVSSRAKGHDPARAETAGFFRGRDPISR